MRDRDWSESFLPILRAAVPLTRSSLLITVYERDCVQSKPNPDRRRSQMDPRPTRFQGLSFDMEERRNKALGMKLGGLEIGPLNCACSQSANKTGNLFNSSLSQTRCLQYVFSLVLTLSLSRVIKCSLTRNITSHSMENLTFHRLLRWRMITLPILTTSLIHFSWKGWENVLFELGSERANPDLFTLLFSQAIESAQAAQDLKIKFDAVQQQMQEVSGVVRDTHGIETAGNNTLFIVRPPRFSVSGYCTNWGIGHYQNEREPGF